MRVDLRLPLAVLLLALALPLKAQGLLSDYFLAVANDKVSDVRDYLKRGVDPNSVDANGDTGLITAARAGNAATVDVLLAARADPERRNRFGDTAMMVAALNGHFGIMKALRAKGAAVDGPGWTPLIYAATGGHEEIVRWLLGEGATRWCRRPGASSWRWAAVAALLLAGCGALSLRTVGRNADWRSNEVSLTLLFRLLLFFRPILAFVL